MFSETHIFTLFSGTQQALGAAKAVSDLILEAKYVTLNMEKFSFDRVCLDEPIYEKYHY